MVEQDEIIEYEIKQCQQDTGQGSGPQGSSYWDKLKARARYLKRLG